MSLSLLSNSSRSNSVKVDTAMRIGRTMSEENLSVEHGSRASRVGFERVDGVRVEVGRVDLLALKVATGKWTVEEETY